MSNERNGWLVIYEANTIKKILSVKGGETFTGKDFSDKLPEEKYASVLLLDGKKSNFSIKNITNRYWKYFCSDSKGDLDKFFADDTKNFREIIYFFLDEKKQVKIVPYDEAPTIVPSKNDKDLLDKSRQGEPLVVPINDNQIKKEIPRTISEHTNLTDDNIALVRSLAEIEYQKLVSLFVEEEKSDSDQMVLIKHYDDMILYIEKSMREMHLHYNEVQKTLDVFQEALWKKPFTELAEKIREIDKFLLKVSSISFSHNEFISVFTSIQSIRKRLMKTLNQLGIEEFKPLKGQRFDPMSQEDDNPESRGLNLSVLECTESGFKTNFGILVKAIVKTIKQI